MRGSVGTSSGLKTSSGVVSTLSSKVHTVMIVGGSSASTVIIYDNASAASGTVLCKITVAAGTSDNVHFPEGVAASNGIYCSISGTGAEAVVVYELSA